MAAMAAARVPVLVDRHADETLRAELVDVMARIDPAAFRQGADAVWLADQRERATRIDVPTLVMVGLEDKVTPPALSDELVQLLLVHDPLAVALHSHGRSPGDYRLGHDATSNTATSSHSGTRGSHATSKRNRHRRLRCAFGKLFRDRQLGL